MGGRVAFVSYFSWGLTSIYQYMNTRTQRLQQRGGRKYVPAACLPTPHPTRSAEPTNQIIPPDTTHTPQCGSSARAPSRGRRMRCRAPSCPAPAPGWTLLGRRWPCPSRARSSSSRGVSRLCGRERRDGGWCIELLLVEDMVYTGGQVWGFC